jgi:hypothetical protein
MRMSDIAFQNQQNKKIERRRTVLLESTRNSIECCVCEI